ncbi:uroporphyrinogen-III C-methyltransferase [Halomonas binhaiensis]|uniref:Uroporphyrinogen-III C-methyltransferase n=1 Tax=Halomonas binhaiensis TaxID=2562282 RepID=A0A5C1NLK3_9GAMM|nr:uroporphyrinogen-III C-methyltransferase [Halomonas binhaiensis]QEM83503.1 uroporphyrinogen-III C-methyltransferase [Halomonas binhaiensis]
MSNQQHDKDEQQTPSGTAPNGAGDSAAGKEGSSGTTRSGQRRSRRRTKGGGERYVSTATSSSTTTSIPSSTSTAAEPSPKAAVDDAKPEASKAADSPSSTAKESKPSEKDSSASKPANVKPAKSDTTASASKASDSKPADSSKTGGSSKSSSSAGSGGSGGSSKTTSSGSGGGKAGVIALILVLILIAGVLFIGWKGWQLQQAMSERLDQLKENSPSVAQVQELSNELHSNLEQRKTSVNETIGGIQSEFADYKADVNQTLDRVLMELAKKQKTDERDWLHAEAAYLLRLANQRLQLERDVGGAVALLRTADNRLEEADNPALVPVRRAIAEELAELQSVPRVDRTGLYLALNAQQEQVAGLPLAQDIKEFTADTTIAEAPTGAWQKQLARVGEELKDLVVVRHHDQPMETLITPEQETYLRQSLRLILEQSQLALLKEEQDLYETSLKKAEGLLNSYYDLDDQKVQAVLSKLDELKGASIHPELPDISASQQALARFIEQRFEATAKGQGDDA